MVVASGVNRLRRELKQSQIGLRSEDFPGLRSKLRCNDTFQEKTGELARRRCINAAVQGHDASKGADAIGIQSAAQGRSRAVTDGHPTGVGVLHHHRCGAACGMAAVDAVAEFPDRCQSRFEIQQIIGAELFPLQLNRASPT